MRLATTTRRTEPDGRDMPPRLPGESGAWVFISGDMMVFALFFCTFMYYRIQEAALFRASQEQLNRDLGAINTFVLLTSSWLVALAVRAIREQRGQLARPLFGAASLCACSFVAVKVLEYGEKLRAGITPATNDFFMYYYTFTGIHLLHVMVGLALLLWMTLRAGPKPATSDLRLFETIASYWHMVDLLWVVLFALLYLLR